MDVIELERLGLNKNEARVYYALLQQKEATAADLVKALGIHRNIVYDNLEKLIEKGLVTFIIKNTKRLFISESPEALIEFLNTKKKKLEGDISLAKKLLPEISSIIGASGKKQSAYMFQGVQGVKKVLSHVLDAKEYWDIGVTNASVDLLGESFWMNFNLKVKHRRIKEHLLLNSDFKKKVGIIESKLRSFRVLPRKLNQITEIVLFSNKVAIFVYAAVPTVVLLEDRNVFNTFKKQFSLLWVLSS